jgi:hypothetical protein
MRILGVKVGKLLPVENGIRTYHVLRYLSSPLTLRFTRITRGGRDQGYGSKLPQTLPGAAVVCTGKRELSGIARDLDSVVHLSAEPPYGMSPFACFPVQAQLRDWVHEQRFDVTVFGSGEKVPCAGARSRRARHSEKRICGNWR